MICIKLSEMKQGMSHLVGGKAYQLGMLMQKGVHVPYGFVFTSEALTMYYDSLKKNNPKLYEQLQSGSIDETVCLDWFNEVPMQHQLIKELTNHLNKDKYYAVRSSSTAEDLEGNSFAGQYLTVLNVRGLDKIEKAIKACWASFWNKRSRSYKENNAIDPLNVSHSVLIQEMIIGQVSGVGFTANPLNGRRDESVIDAAWGLCEGVVNGLVTSDHIVVDKCNRTIKTYHVHNKQYQIINTKEGIDTIAVPEEKKKKKCLTEQAILQLVKQMDVIEQHLRKPVDIEWTINKDTLYILQARPVTTLLPLPDPSRDVCHDPVHILADFNTISQGVKEPMTPMGQESLIYYFSGSFSLLTGKACHRPKWASFIKGRLYLDLTVFMTKKMLRKGLASKFSIKDPSAGEAFMEVVDRNAESFKHSDVKFRLPMRLPLRMMKHLYFPMIRGFLKGKKHPERAMDMTIEYGDATLKKIQELFEHADSPALTLEAIWKAQPMMMKFSFIQYSYCAYGFLAIKEAEKLIKKYNVHCDLELVRRSMPTNPTTIMGHEMMAIAVFFSRHPKEKLSPKHPKIKGFLAKYGHRGNIEMDFGTPRWREEPHTVIEMIKGYIQSPNIEDLYNQMEEENKLAEKEIENICSQIEQSAGKSKAKKVLKALNDYRMLAGLREQPKFYLIQINDYCRTHLLTIGQTLVKYGKIDTASDVAFLDEKTLLSGKEDDFRQHIKQNKMRYEQDMKIHRLPPIMTSKGECIYGPTKATDGLKGYPVAPGKVKGRIRKLLKPDATQLEKGDILLTYSTNPAWTPLFILAGGLIMESGGVMSHGSIVAREYGIPAVVLAGSVNLFKDGQYVTIDGNSGLIERIEPEK